jgi:hypothetical protein
MVKLPNYNPDGKKLTWFQHMEKIRKTEEAEKQKLEQNKGETPGCCSVCGGSGFTLKCEPGVLIRTCKNENCGDQKMF